MKPKKRKDCISFHTKKAPYDKETSLPQKRRRLDYLKCLCWGLLPIVTVSLLVLDAVGIYTFNENRLLVLGVGFTITLLPCFSEISIKNLTVRRDKSDK